MSNEHTPGPWIVNECTKRASASYKLARATLRTAVREYGWSRRDPNRDAALGYPVGYTYGPGKFEGEHWSIVHWFDAAMNGMADVPLYDGGDDVAADVLEVSDVERAAFGLKESDQFAVLWYSPQGFVSLEYIDACRYDKLRRHYDKQAEE